MAGQVKNNPHGGGPIQSTEQVLDTLQSQGAQIDSKDWRRWIREHELAMPIRSKTGELEVETAPLEEGSALREEVAERREPPGDGKVWAVTVGNSSTDTSLAISLEAGPVEIAPGSIDIHTHGYVFVGPQDKDGEKVKQLRPDQVPVKATKARDMVPGSELTLFYESVFAPSIRNWDFSAGVKKGIAELGPIEVGPRAFVGAGFAKGVSQLDWAVSVRKLQDTDGKKKVELVRSERAHSVDEGHIGVGADLGIPLTIRGVLNMLPVRVGNDAWREKLKHFSREPGAWKQFAQKLNHLTSAEATIGGEQSKGWAGKETFTLDLSDPKDYGGFTQADAYELYLLGNRSGVDALAAQGVIEIARVKGNVVEKASGGVARIGEVTFYEREKKEVQVKGIGETAELGLVTTQQYRGEHVNDGLFSDRVTFELKYDGVDPVGPKGAIHSAKLGYQANNEDATVDEYPQWRLLTGPMKRSMEVSNFPAYVPDILPIFSGGYETLDTKIELGLTGAGLERLRQAAGSRQKVLAAYSAAHQEVSGRSYQVDFNDDAAARKTDTLPSQAKARDYHESEDEAAKEAALRAHEAFEPLRTPGKVDWTQVGARLRELLDTDEQQVYLHLGALTNLVGAENVKLQDFQVTQDKDDGQGPVLVLGAKREGEAGEPIDPRLDLTPKEGEQQKRPHQSILTRRGRAAD